jgi:PAS domain S-box-containing protein
VIAPLAAAAAYYACARAAAWLAVPGFPVAAFWPAAGVAFAAMYRAPPRRWPLVLCAVVAANLLADVPAGRPPWVAAIFATTEAAFLAAAALSRRALAGRSPFDGVRDLVRFAGVAAAVLSLGLLPFALAGSRAFSVPLGQAWLAAMTGKTLGVVAIAPALLLWRPHTRPMVVSRRGAEALAVVVLLVVGAAMLHDDLLDGVLFRQYLFTPALAWAALRFGAPGVALVGPVVSALVFHGLSRGAPALAQRGVSIPEAVSELQLMVGVLLAAAYVLAVATAERRRAIAEVREAREQFDAFLRHAPLDLFIKEAGSGRLVAVSRHCAAAIFGAAPEAVTGRTLQELWPRERVELAERQDEQVLRGRGAAEFEVERDGRSLSLMKFPIPREGRETLIGGVVLDVTDRRAAELQSRMASLGTLAAGVAHEINNPLAFVSANLDYAAARLRAADGPADEVLVALEEAREGARRVGDIVRDLKTFSRSGPGDRRLPVDVRAPLAAAANLARNEIRHRARVVAELGEVPPVEAAEHRLAQVFLNLLVNAAQAIPEGRREEHEIRLRTGVARDGRVAVEVRDSGAGMDEEVRRRIFEPFFTTKPAGTGTGLGLSICHGIVKAHGGEIEVESAPGEGSTFRVLLPPAGEGVAAAAPAPAAAAPSAAPPSPPPARRRVLVVDDEALVARAVGRILRAEHDVVHECDPRAALARLSGGEACDLVLCDLMMPEMSGMELHRRLAELRPELRDRFVFMTGGAFTAQAREYLDTTTAPPPATRFDGAARRAAIAAKLAA